MERPELMPVPTNRTVEEDKRQLEREMRKMRKAFIKKFGREQGPDDPVFWEADAPGPTPVPLHSNSEAPRIRYEKLT